MHAPKKLISPAFIRLLKIPYRKLGNRQRLSFIIPINTWHNQHYYRAEKIDGVNEWPSGLGVGKYRYDEDGDWHGLYATVFLDLHDDV